MHWVTAVLVYVITWWTVLFAVLPFGTHAREEPDPVTGWRGAPERPMMGRKLLATTAVATVIWGAILVAVASNVVTFRPS